MATILASDAKLVEATSAPLPWQSALAKSVRSGAELLELLGLSPNVRGDLSEADAAAEDFPVFVPREFVARMRAGDAHDPLLRQVLAIADERLSFPDFSDDPVGDAEAEVLPGLLQKYRGRALMIVSGACAVHCRYCFRRAFPYSDAPKGPRGWQAAIDHLAGDTSVDEVLLSGGDPLAVTDEQLGWLSDRLSEIGHLRRLRIHTRFPIVIPQRVCDALISWLERSRLSLYLVIHANHPREIDDSVRAAMARLKKTGVTLLNQAVLLRGVNDSVEVQEELCRQMIDMGVLPYYLHQLDRVRGAAHFESRLEVGRKIIDALRARLPGYAVPAFVKEVAGDASKRPL